MTGYFARGSVGRASLHLGRPALAVLRPPVRTPMIIESWIPEAKRFVETANFLATYARWESCAGVGRGSSGSVLPVLDVTADQLSFHSGMDLELSPSTHAETVRELIELIPRLEMDLTGRDPLLDPIPAVTLTEPMGSVPDVRPAYLCPRCGKLEILRRVYDGATGLTHARTLGCGVDVFPPWITRARDVYGAAERVIQN